MISKVLHRIKKWFFWLNHARHFKTYSFSSTILDSLKIDGHRYISIGRNVYVHKSVWLSAFKVSSIPPDLFIADGVCLGNFNHITCVGKVVIKKKVLTADRVYISDNLHNYNDPSRPIIEQGSSFKNEVVIGEGAWIGENVCIIGASVGKNSVIGANSVVTKNIPDYCVAVGSPAKVIKKYNFEKEQWVSIDTISG
jgi:acetyltransferase-like isoleucine patch superfamily enzyme